MTRRIGIIAISRWFAKKPRQKEVLMLPLVALGLMIYCIIVSAINIAVLGQDVVSLGMALKPENAFIPWNMFVAIVASPSWEEVVFRVLPLGFAIFLSQAGMKRFILILTTLIFSSVAFGLTHGAVHNLPMQGVVGFCFGLIFLKWALPARDPWAGISKGALAVMCTHGMYNALMLALTAIAMVATTS